MQRRTVTEIRELEQVLDRLLTRMSLMITSQVGENGVDLRHQIGIVDADYKALLEHGEMGTELLACFTEALDAGVTLEKFVDLRENLFKEDPAFQTAQVIVQAAIMFCLSAESQLIIDTEFKSRDDVDATMKRMNVAFNTAKELAADAMDSDSYQALNNLAGALTNHLYATALPLPRIVRFKMSKPMPVLKLAQRVYYDPSRWLELLEQNKVVNPVFVPKEFVGLSN